MIVVGLTTDKVVFDELEKISLLHQLNLALTWHELDKINQKSLMNFAVEQRIFMGIIKGLPTLLYYTGDETYQHYELIKISANWQSLTKRIVTAGRKSELLLQACKLTSEMTAIDCTAGFGHDGLILASTGASVAMIEQNPVMFLLLQYEYQHMQQNPNWQKLLSRIGLHFGSAIEVLPTLSKAAVVYLDPMFPSDSYSAKVNKNMQVLHALANPPTVDEERLLLKTASHRLNPNGKVVVKRPKAAPFLAQFEPNDSVSNDVLRFDIYS